LLIFLILFVIFMTKKLMNYREIQHYENKILANIIIYNLFQDINRDTTLSIIFHYSFLTDLEKMLIKKRMKQLGFNCFFMYPKIFSNKNRAKSNRNNENFSFIMQPVVGNVGLIKGKLQNSLRRNDLFNFFIENKKLLFVCGYTNTHIYDYKYLSIFLKRREEEQYAYLLEIFFILQQFRFLVTALEMSRNN